MKLEYLCDNEQYVDVVAKWIYNEFIDGIKPGISYEKIKNIYRNRKKECIPIAIIAVQNNDCVGVASLVANDLKAREYTPWLAGLYVKRQYRNRRIGNILIQEVQSIAYKLGHDVLYLRTEHAYEYYRSLGWKFVEKLVDEFDIETNIFSHPKKTKK